MVLLKILPRRARPRETNRVEKTCMSNVNSSKLHRSMKGGVGSVLKPWENGDP